jgi:hypothetical protein
MRIIVMIPTTGQSREAVTQSFHSYRTTKKDAEACLVDLGRVSY